MPARRTLKGPRPRKAYPKRKSVRSTVMQRAMTLEYTADPVPPVYAMSRSNKEQKFLDMAQVSQDCPQEPGPADIVLLNQIGQGTSVNTRIGMRYNLTGVHIRGQIRQVGVQNVSPAIAGFLSSTILSHMVRWHLRRRCSTYATKTYRWLSLTARRAKRVGGLSTSHANG